MHLHTQPTVLGWAAGRWRQGLQRRPKGWLEQLRWWLVWHHVVRAEEARTRRQVRWALAQLGGRRVPRGQRLPKGWPEQPRRQPEVHQMGQAEKVRRGRG